METTVTAPEAARHFWDTLLRSSPPRIGSTAAITHGVHRIALIKAECQFCCVFSKWLHHSLAGFDI
ncbi:MAG: hypothetical protein ABSE62_15095 [Chthoniobacteraceae bacterium]|jgi:hypothetical protein